MRFDDWTERLAAFIEARRHQPFVWGTSDCCLFAADAVLAITGKDFAAQYRGQYATALAACRYIKAAGDVEKLVPLTKIDVNLAGRGDVVMIETPTGFALAVHLGRTIAGQGPEGIVFLPTDKALVAWKAEA